MFVLKLFDNSTISPKMQAKGDNTEVDVRSGSLAERHSSGWEIDHEPKVGRRCTAEGRGGGKESSGMRKRGCEWRMRERENIIWGGRWRWRCGVRGLPLNKWSKFARLYNLRPGRDYAQNASRSVDLWFGRHFFFCRAPTALFRQLCYTRFFKDDEKYSSCCWRVCIVWSIRTVICNRLKEKYFNIFLWRERIIITSIEIYFVYINNTKGYTW